MLDTLMQEGMSLAERKFLAGRLEEVNGQVSKSASLTEKVRHNGLYSLICFIVHYTGN
jgi:hypothetical protein